MGGAMAKTVLIVEDEPTTSELFSFMLEAGGFDVLTAPHGRAALEVISREGVDLILSDVMMPVMDGVELCTELRRRGVTPRVPFIIVTAAIEWVRLDGCEPVAILRKPLDMERLLEAVTRALPEG
jgi:CheY-like chemotaxis protein